MSVIKSMVVVSVVFMCVATGVPLVFSATTFQSGKGKAQAESACLTPAGEKLQAEYAAALTALRAEITNALPVLNEGKKTVFQEAREAATQATTAARAQAITNELNAAQAILADLTPFLSSDKLDAQLVKCSVLAQATPKGLAEFAQQGPEQEALVAKLLADTGLMKEMLEAGGAKDDKYGLAMQIYTQIQKTSPRATDGILRRLALGTCLEMTVPFRQSFSSYLSKKARPVDPLKRYLNYEKAYLAGELDPAFNDLTPWEYRFVVNDPSSDEEILWMRETMRNYRPDHMTNPDYCWRYVRIVRTDVPFVHTKWPETTSFLPMQDAFKLGGICHIRAWAGRLALRSFGIPVWGVEQVGHTALSHWTPAGWVINFGAGWHKCYATERSDQKRMGTDFLLETQARKCPQNYWKVLRAQWVGDALSEQKCDSQKNGSGGWWNVMALFEKKAIAAAAKPIQLAALGTELGEANESAATHSVLVAKANAMDEDKKAVVATSGEIIIPAAACTGNVQQMKSFLGGRQAFCAGPFSCSVDAPRAGKYQLTARVVTLHGEGQLQVTVNNAQDPIDVVIPYSCSKWEHTKPVEVALVQGKNELSFLKPERGFTFKDITLTPVK